MRKEGGKMQKALFPILKTWESQSMNTGSHKDTYAIDFGVLNPYNVTELTAPFDGKIVFVDTQANGGGIAMESLEKVKYVDGTTDYMTLWTGHDNNPPKLGTIFKQGEVYSHMGTAGGVQKHCHLEVIRGKFKMTFKVTSMGSYKFDNTIEPYKALFLNKDSLIKYSKYKWTLLPEVEFTPPEEKNTNVNQLKVIVDNLRVRKEHNTLSKVIGYVQNNAIYNDLETYYDGTYTWHKIMDNEWIADNGEWLELLPRTFTKEEVLENENNKLKKEIEEVKSINTNLNNEINSLKNKLKEIHKISYE